MAGNPSINLLFCVLWRIIFMVISIGIAPPQKPVNIRKLSDILFFLFLAADLSYTVINTANMPITI